MEAAMKRELSLDADGLARRISELSPQRREMLERLLRAKSDVARSAAIPRRSSSSPAPLSFAQERLWFLDQLLPGNTLYNYDNAVRYRGPLDVAVLARSLNEMVARHEALRTTFQMIAGQPMQVIAPSLSVALPITDLRAYPEPRQRRKRSAWPPRRPGARSILPPVRCCAPRWCGWPRATMFCSLTIHHIISDGWSLVVLFRELRRACGFAPLPASPLPPLPIQYADFAVWQRHWLQGQVLRISWRTGNGSSLASPHWSCRPTIRGRPSTRPAARASRLPCARTSCISRSSASGTMQLCI